jgi:hypothetical protein
MNDDRSLHTLFIRQRPMHIFHRLRFAAVAAAVSGFILCSNAAILPTDGSRADVQAKIDSAVDGDTVELPSGIFVWPSAVTIAGKGIHLKGKGAGRVVARSLSSVTVGTGTKTFSVITEDIRVGAIQSLKSKITNGTSLKIWRTGGEQGPNGNTGKMPWLRGTVTSFSGSTLTMDITSTDGSSGTHPAWIITTEAETTIIHDGPSNTNALRVVEDASHNVEISGIRFEHSARGARSVINQLHLDPSANGKPNLVHDCYFQQTNAGDNLRAAVHRGVVWNCSFVALPMSFNYLAIHSVVENFSESWITPSTMGTSDVAGTNNFYIEDCDMHGYVAATDFDSNTRAVARHCLMNHASFGSHGADTSSFGVRHVELYDNVMVFNPFSNGQTLNTDRHINMRGGTWVVTDNNIDRMSSQDWGNKTDIKLEAQNIHRNGGPNPGWGFGIFGIQYPCPRQVGMGRITGNGVDGKGRSADLYTYVGDLEPVYIWNNTGIYNVGVLEYGWQPGTSVGLNLTDFIANADKVADYIKLGRDYFTSVAKPEWVKPSGSHPAAYPHSLRGAPRFVQITVVQ